MATKRKTEIDMRVTIHFRCGDFLTCDLKFAEVWAKSPTLCSLIKRIVFAP